MKRTFYIVAFLLIGSFVLRGQKGYRLNPDSIDFGMIDKFSRTEQAKIWLVNTGKDSLKIYSFNWGQNFCPCTYRRKIMPPGDSTEFLLHCTGFGTERKFSKRFSVYTSAGDIHYPFKGEFRSIPHATEVDKTDFRLKKKRNMRQGESYEFAFTVTNLTDSLTVISRFNAADFFKMDRSTRLIPPHESRKIAVRFIAPKRPKASAITALISGSYHEIISFKMLNQGFIETAIIKVDAYVK